MGGYCVFLMYFAYENRRGPVNIFFLGFQLVVGYIVLISKHFFGGANQVVYLDFTGYTVMNFGWFVSKLNKRSRPQKTIAAKVDFIDRPQLFCDEATVGLWSTEPSCNSFILYYSITTLKCLNPTRNTPILGILNRNLVTGSLHHTENILWEIGKLRQSQGRIF